jgi:hypothetical protein
MIFVAHGGNLAPSQVMAVGSSNLALRQNKAVDKDDHRSIASAPAQKLTVPAQSLTAKPATQDSVIEVIPGDGQTGSNSESHTANDDSKDRRDRRRCEYQVATHLTKLDSIDPKRVVTVRKIHVFGFDAAKIIRSHFSQYGVVEDVLLCRSKEEGAQPVAGYRHRPSRFCFLVMSSEREAQTVLSAGAMQKVSEATVYVQQFVPKVLRDRGPDTRPSQDQDVHLDTMSDITEITDTGSEFPKSSESIPAEPANPIRVPDCRFWITRSLKI